ncbi:helix-turn-helix transcriptional regulator [Kitasatospora azatica]|uniref:helix-turn-helix transcriptional regulator n=1 Tax=Kitasatospora azatica TaxID=58347 RepID=UPI00056D06F7|nr:helix-turn-helix transcriptional regulator [Kitasatospora azatica]
MSVHQDRPTRAATLFGTAAAAWHDIGEYTDLYIPAHTVHELLVGTVRASIGDAGYEKAFRHGSRLGREQAAAFALDQQDRPGPVPQSATAETTLTPREEEIAELLADGLSNKDIADRLVIAPRTAETHVAHILSKLGLTSRAQVAAWCAAQRHAAAAAD